MPVLSRGRINPITQTSEDTSQSRTFQAEIHPCYISTFGMRSKHLSLVKRLGNNHVAVEIAKILLESIINMLSRKKELDDGVGKCKIY